MKAETTERVCVYRNTDHEQLTSRELEQCRQALQELLDLWQHLDIGPCQDINLLVMRPETAYKKAIDRLVEVPAAGRFAIKKEDYIKTLTLPDPSPLYAMAKVTRQKTYCAVPELWSCDVDGRVILDELESAQLISSQSVYAVSPAAITLAQDLQKFVALWNSLNVRLNGELISPVDSFLHRWSADKFRITGYPPVLGKIELLPDVMRRWLAKAQL